MSTRYSVLSTRNVLLIAMLATGCTGSSSVPDVSRDPSAYDHAHDWHRPGAHHGLIVKISPNKYHGEVLFEKGGVVRLYTLGQDWREVLAIDSQALTAYAKALGEREATAFDLQPTPQTDDPPGKTSQFVGQLPKELHNRPVEVSIRSLRIGEERFRVEFQSEVHEDLMPAKIVDEEEKQLYLTPGGKYTQADIDANGRQTASQRYAAFKAAHDLRPKSGEAVCPVTRTKAHPQCTWVIDGKVYSFCCPPCIDEFIAAAKERPATIQDPSAYVKK